MNPADTIAAIATGPAQTSRALLRIAGPQTHAALPTLLSPYPSTPHTITTTRFALTDSLAFPALAIRFDAPRSFTADDTLELLIPGNPHLARRALERTLTLPGFRHATPGEFSARAYLAGKLSLEQAEGIAASIAAHTTAQIAAARDLLAGTTGSRYRDLAERLTTLLALTEAAIDFTDQEDVVPIPPAELHDRIGDLITNLTTTLGPSAASHHTTHAPSAVLVGPPNAGKSTLFNALLARPRAVTSPAAGTTRDILTEPLDLSAETPGAPTILLSDIAGLNTPPSPPSTPSAPSASSRPSSPSSSQQTQAAPQGRAPSESPPAPPPHAPQAHAPQVRAPAATIDALAQHAARTAINAADVLIYCDPTARFPERSLPPSTPTIRVQTFADQPAQPARHADAPTATALPVCALDGYNLPALRRAIADAAAASLPGSSDLLPRHRLALAAARDSLTSARDLVAPHTNSRALPDTELTAHHLRTALDHLASLVGDISPDDVIARVFATFCVGK